MNPRSRALGGALALFVFAAAGWTVELFAERSRGKADLVIQWVHPTKGVGRVKGKPHVVRAGERVPVELEVANIGRTYAPGPISVQMRDHPGSFEFSERVVSGLKAREKKRLSGTVWVPARQPAGLCQLVFKIDVNERVKEENETNNTWTLTLNVQR